MDACVCVVDKAAPNDRSAEATPKYRMQLKAILPCSVHASMSGLPASSFLNLLHQQG